MPTRNRTISQLFGGPDRAFLLEATSSPKGFSIVSPVLFGSYLVIAGFFFTSENIGGISYHWLDFSVLVSSVSFFLLVKSLFKSYKGNQLVLNVSTWLGTGVIGVFIPAFVVWAVSGDWNKELLAQLPLGLISYPTLSFILAVAISGSRISASNMRRLNRDQQLLKSKRNQLLDEIDSIRGEIRLGVDQELLKAFDVVANKDLSPQEISASLFGAIDDVIRPLSHRLAGVGGVSEFPPTKAPPVLQPRGSLKRVQISRIIAPEDFFIGSLIFVLPVSYLFNGLPGLALSLLLALVIAAVLAFLKSKTVNVESPRILAVALVSGVALVLGSTFSAVFQGKDSSGVSVGFAAVALVSASTMAIISRRIQIIEHLAFVNDDIQSVVAILRQEAWVLKTQLAKAIHGQVQAKFLAVALRLASKKKVSKRDLEAARADLQMSLNVVDESFSERQLSFSDQLKTISDSWDKVVEIVLSASANDVATVDEHPLTRTCLIQVIGEAVSNAAKHSKAPKITVEFLVSDANVLEVKVKSEGRLSPIDNSRSGYGSQILNEITSAWSLSSVKGRVFLEETIHLAK